MSSTTTALVMGIIAVIGVIENAIARIRAAFASRKRVK